MVTTTQTADLVSSYSEHFAGSKTLFDRASEVFMDGVTHDSRRAYPFPIYVERAEGGHKWDVDGHEIIDWVSGHGSLLLGHNHPAVVEATIKQLKVGTHFGAGHELEVRWGELVRDLVPSADMVRFTASGTEATMLALRIARAATGRKQIVKFNGHFHGWHDYTMRGRGASTDHVAGVPAEVEDTVTLLAPDIDDFAGYIAGDSNLAAVILEPSGAAWGTAPLPRGFLAELRRLTTQEGIVLIMDEVITGFRWAPGGAQERYGVTPDLTTMAKILAGGLPGGAVAGRRELMETFGFDRAKEQPSRKVPHMGTFNANPLSAAAGIACLELIADGEAQRRADMLARELRERLNDSLQELELPGFVYGESSVFHIALGFGAPGDAEKAENGELDGNKLLAAPFTAASLALNQAMLLEGVHFFVNAGGLVSAVHTEEDVQQTVAAFQRALPLVEPLLQG